MGSGGQPPIVFPPQLSVVSKICMLLLLLFSVSKVEGQFTCLVSRLDIVPCNVRNPSSTRTPKPNEYGIYNTRIGMASSGTFKCDIRRKKHKILEIRSVGNTSKVYILNSPGITLQPPVTYGNQQYVDYRVQCPGRHLAFFNITKIDMEPPNCFDPNKKVMTCVDYVRVDRGKYGITESCGNDTSGNMEELEFGSFQVIFRTSNSGRFPGFTAFIICFDPETRDMPGCTRPKSSEEGSTDMSTTSATTSMDNGRKRRRKRDLEAFHNEWRRRASYIKRIRRQTGEGGGTKLRFREIIVVHGINVTYSDKTLDFISVENGSIIPSMSIKDIISLHTFDAEGMVDAFKEEARTGGQDLLLPGPGPMFIVGQYAYFQLFVIDPRGLVPNAEEMQVIANITNVQMELTREDNSSRLDLDFLEPPTFNPVDAGFPPSFGRKRRQVDMTPLTDQALILSLQNENACNPVVKATANSFIQEAEKEDPMRVRMLRESLVTVTPVPTNSTG